MLFLFENFVLDNGRRELRAGGTISLAWIENQMPFQRDAERKHYMEAFRRAGLI